MSISVRRSKLLIALAACVASLSLGLLGPGAAHAGTGTFCNPVTLGDHGECRGGSYVKLNQTYGWGDQHSVCVGVAVFNWSFRCSSGPGAGVYSTKVEYMPYIPAIRNNASGSNTVHGVYLYP